MMKLLGVVCGIVMMIGIAKNSMAGLDTKKEQMQKTAEQNMNMQQNAQTNCPDPFSLQGMGSFLTYEMKIIGSAQNSQERHNIKLTTQSDQDPEKFVCKYQIYCAAVQVQPYEAFLGVTKDGQDNLQTEMENKRKKFIETQAELNSLQQSKASLIDEKQKSLRLKKVKLIAQRISVDTAQLIDGYATNAQEELAIQSRRMERQRKTRQRQRQQQRRLAKSNQNLQKIKQKIKKKNKLSIQQKQQMMEAERAFLTQQGTCDKCPGNFEFNLRLKPMVQVLKKGSDNTQYAVNEVSILRQTYDEKFNSDKENEAPVIKKIECYVSFEPSGLVLLGDEYGHENFGNPNDLFRDVFLVTLGDDYRITFDLTTDYGPQYLPELTKLSYDLLEEGCLGYCDLVSYGDLAYTRQQIEIFDEGRRQLEQLDKFEADFNDRHLGNIKSFIESIQTVYKINEVCAKVVKLLKFGEFRDGLFTNLATAGSLRDYYNGDSLNTNEMGLYDGFKNQFMTTLITFDRQCMINKMFGRGMYQ